jgi:prefoldin subunit 5
MPGAQATPSPEAEKEVLTRQAESLQAQLDNLRKRLEELATEGKVS